MNDGHLLKHTIHDMAVSDCSLHPWFSQLFIARKKPASSRSLHEGKGEHARTTNQVYGGPPFCLCLVLTHNQVRLSTFSHKHTYPSSQAKIMFIKRNLHLPEKTRLSMCTQTPQTHPLKSHVKKSSVLPSYCHQKVGGHCLRYRCPCVSYATPDVGSKK